MCSVAASCFFGDRYLRDRTAGFCNVSNDVKVKIYDNTLLG
jgi:hypothetical protein